MNQQRIPHEVQLSGNVLILILVSIGEYIYPLHHWALFTISSYSKYVHTHYYSILSYALLFYTIIRIIILFYHTHYCQAQPQPQLNLADVSSSLQISTPPTHPTTQLPVKVVKWPPHPPLLP